ncbi:MAG: YoaK family protein [Ignavibacteriota bacterium]
MEARRSAEYVETGSVAETAPLSIRLQSWRAAARAAICGYIDAYTLLSFGVYASFMTGNTTSAGIRIGQSHFTVAAHSLLPVPFFLLGILAATLLAQENERRTRYRLSAIAGGLLAFEVAAFHLGCPLWLNMGILSVAMGFANTSITHVGAQAVSLGFMTGDLNNLARQVALGIRRKPAPQSEGPWDTPWRRANLLASLWIAFFSGAILGTILTPHLASWTALLPALLLLLFAWWEFRAALAE